MSVLRLFGTSGAGDDAAVCVDGLCALPEPGRASRGGSGDGDDAGSAPHADPDEDHGAGSGAARPAGL
jgi:hypothetical protein